MRRTRNELAKDINKMLALRERNMTFRQIAKAMGYKSPGTVSDLLRNRGYFSIVFSQLQISYILNLLNVQPENRLVKDIIKRLKAVIR